MSLKTLQLIPGQSEMIELFGQSLDCVSLISAYPPGRRVVIFSSVASQSFSSPFLGELLLFLKRVVSR